LMNRHDYVYNLASQRTYQTRTDGSYVHYDYEAIGQLTGALGSGGLSRERLGYSYDPAWNLAWRTNSGNPQAFQVDGLNQLTNSPLGREYYDANGHLTNADGLTYSYDDENRLVVLEQPGAAGNWRTEFVYDGLGRLRVWREFDWFLGGPTDMSLQSTGKKAGKKASPPVQSTMVGGGEGYWFLNTETHYVYDGRRVIHERDSYDQSLVNYTRGRDLSGTLEAAGGIGGLLARSASGSHAYYHADGNGNVTYMLATNKSLAARYVYDPYGNLLSQAGALADANLYRFSSKEFHPRSGLYYYLYRWYDPRVQRWVNHDIIEEAGSANLYVFADSDPENKVDFLGLVPACTKWGPAVREHHVGKKQRKFDHFTPYTFVRIDEEKMGKWIPVGLPPARRIYIFIFGVDRYQVYKYYQIWEVFRVDHWKTSQSRTCCDTVTKQTWTETRSIDEDQRIFLNYESRYREYRKYLGWLPGGGF
jgi:RHS repeat-associated protein